MVDSGWRSTSQFSYWQSDINHTASLRRGSAPDNVLSSNRSPESSKGSAYRRRAASDAVALPSPILRAVHPALYLKRKGPRPFRQLTPTPLTRQVSCRTWASDRHFPIDNDEVEGAIHCDLSRVSQLPGLTDHEHGRFTGNTSIFGEDRMIGNWLCQKPHGQASPFSLSTRDMGLNESNVTFSLDRMSLALFDFGTTPIELRRRRFKQKGSSQTPGDQMYTTPLPSDPLSTPSISLEDVTIFDDGHFEPRGKLRESRSASVPNVLAQCLNESTYHGLFMEETDSTSASKASRLGKAHKSTPRLWDRKPPGLTLDLGPLSFLHSHNRSRYEPHPCDPQKSPVLQEGMTETDFSKEPLNDYPFPRMDIYDLHENESYRPAPIILNIHKHTMVQKWLSEIDPVVS